jgi:hypothetical protein
MTSTLSRNPPRERRRSFSFADGYRRDGVVCGRSTVQDVLEKIARVQQWTGFAVVCAFAGIVIGLR